MPATSSASRILRTGRTAGRPRRWLASLVAIAALAVAGAAQADELKRVALIIGNRDYKIWKSLTNSVEDAKLIHDALITDGFTETDIVYVENADMTALTGAMRKFSEKARGADLVFVYYTGHGAKIGPTNWVIPTDAPDASALKDANAGNYAIPVDRLISVANEGGFGVVLIDACRENLGSDPDSAGGATKGATALGMSTQDLPVPRGVLLQTSTQDGKAAYDGGGKHSLYAMTVNKHLLEEPDRNIKDMLKAVETEVADTSNPKQRPALVDKLTTDIWMSLKSNKPPAGYVPERRPEDEAKAKDDATWEFVQKANSVNAYETYLKTPDARHLAEAKAAIERLQAGGGPKDAGPVLADQNFAGTPDEARRAVGALSDTEWRSDFPQVLALKVLTRTNGAGVKALSESGNDPATVILAALYEIGGGGLPKDLAQAKLLYERAAEKNNPIALRVQGEMLRLGRDGEPPRPLEALKPFEKAALAGDAIAQDRLGSLYADGVEGEAGKKKALGYFEKAAAQNDAWAQCHLAAIYGTGALGVRANPKLAVSWAQSSADQHNFCGEMMLGHMYLYGENGLAKDPDRGAALYQRAAERGFPEALTSLGLLYQSGEGIPRDIQAAIGNFRRAADQGYAPAQYLLGAVYASDANGVPKDLISAVKYFRLAAAQNNSSGQAALGWAYADGLGGLRRDDTEAVRLFNKAAEAKDPDGEFRLGLMIANGRAGAQKGASLAGNFMKASAAQGYSAAQQWLDSHR